MDAEAHEVRWSSQIYFLYKIMHELYDGRAFIVRGDSRQNPKTSFLYRFMYNVLHLLYITTTQTLMVSLVTDRHRTSWIKAVELYLKQTITRHQNTFDTAERV